MIFSDPTFHATYAATKFANPPPIMSTNPNPPNTFATIVPNVKPIMAGIPKIIDRGSIASAILICIGKKLIGANPITKAEYNALIIAINDISLLFIFTSRLPGFAERL